LEAYLLKFYNIHDLLKIGVENLELNHMLQYFSTDEAIGTTDFTIRIGGFDTRSTFNKMGRFFLAESELVEKRNFGSLRLKEMLGKTELNATIGYVRARPFITLIESIIGFKLITKNNALVHSSCVSRDGEGYLICAWHGTGKTMVTLKLVKEKGLDFLSDDMTVIDTSGQAYCFPKDVKLSLPHAKEFGLDGKVKLKLLVGELVTHIPVIRRHLEITHNAPVTKIVKESKIEKQCKLRKVMVLQQADKEEVLEIDSNEITKRLLLLNEWERIFWIDRLFIPYAFSDKKFDLQKIAERERDILQRALKDVPCYEVRFRKYAYDQVAKLVMD
jgi:hypothetical protein